MIGRMLMPQMLARGRVEDQSDQAVINSSLEC